MPVSDAWTCGQCSETYWPPSDGAWSKTPTVWAAARREAQRVHGVRHAQEKIDAADGLPAPDQSGIHGHRLCLCRHPASQHGPLRRRCLTAGCDCRLFVAKNAQP